MAASDDYKVTKLNGNNYHSWCVRLKAILIQKGHWNAVNPGYNAEMTETEQLNNDKALSYIILSVEDSVLDEIENCTRAKEAWDSLEEAYTKYGLLHALHVRRDLHNSKKIESLTMLDYINEIIEKNRRLKNSGFAFDDRELALLILMGLPPVYDQLILHFEQLEDSLTTKEVKRKLLLEEKRVIRREEDNVKVEGDDAKAYRTQQYQNKRETLQDEKTSGNYKRYVKCFCCGNGGHIARECYFNPESPNFKKGNEAGEEKKISEAKLTRSMKKCNIEYLALCVVSENPLKKGYWYIDSAADEYMCNDLAKFEDFKPCVRTVRVADERLLSVKGTGTVKIKMCKENGGKSLIMKNVSYIPDLTDNLLSVGKLTEAKIKLMFKDNKVFATRENETIFTGERHGRMYRVYEETATAKLTKTDDFELLHRRMGHIDKKKIDCIVGRNKARGDRNDTVCEVCMKGKMKKKPFNTSTTKTTQPLELVHSDIMGPIKPESKGGAKYVATFTDDYSRYSKVYYMKAKSEVAQIFAKYHKVAEIETGCKLKMLRSDNGREYINKDFDQYLQEEGITRQLTVPYNPQQNGIAERLNQTLTNMASCLLIEGNLPKELWAEAIHTANYLRNRSPSSAINERVPLELWCKEKATYDNLKVFGCQVWRYIEKGKRSKFDEKARRCVFVGYPDGVKGFKVWDYEEDKFYVSRDVKFEENVFPFQTGSSMIPEKKQEEIPFLFKEEANDEPGREQKEESFPAKEAMQEQTRNDNEVNSPELNFDESPEEFQEAVLRRSQRMPKLKVCKTCDYTDQGHCSQVEHLESTDPKTLREALESPDAAKWKQAMKREINALEDNHTWEIIRRPKNAHVIQGKWVFKRKKNENNEVIEYKARLVARGFQQIPDLEFDEVYSPVVKLKSIRIILAIAAQRRWPVYHFDIASAYLNGILDKTVLMELPKMVLDEDKEEWVCSLNKGLYGLKQGGRQWNQSIDEFLQQCDLHKAKSDPCVYFSHEGTMILALHVDDIMMICENEEIYQQFGDKLKKRYKSKDLGQATHLLSMRVSRNENGDIAVDQCHLIEEILKHYRMEDAKPASTPLDRGVKFKRGMRETQSVKSIPYRQLLGSLMYLANSTRPDLSFVTSYMSQFNEDFSSEHWAGMKHILRYLQKTKDLKLTYCVSAEKLHGYCDADWGSDPHDRKSFGGYIFRLASGAVTWCSRKQHVTALSSTEAEFLQMVQATREFIWLKTLLTVLVFSINNYNK